MPALRISGLEERTKTDAGWRVIGVPPSTVELLGRRLADPRLAGSEVMFPSPLGRVRDTSKAAADIRRVVDRAGFDWVSSHTLRKTVATRLDDCRLLRAPDRRPSRARAAVDDSGRVPRAPGREPGRCSRP